jgi:predicted MFS family arabinose efflux permease
VKTTSAPGVALLGGAIIAITYGLARFVFGLFLPAIRDDMEFGPTVAGIIGGLPFASFVIAVVAAPVVSESIGPRWAATLATALAVAGLLAVAGAPGPVILAIGVLTCGLSTGLSSPVMAHAVHSAVVPAVRGRVNATINAGTSLGIAAATPVIWWGQEAWRPAYLLFAAVAAFGLIAASVGLPHRGTEGQETEPAEEAPTREGRKARRNAIIRLTALAGTMGTISAAFWVFAPDFVITVGSLSRGVTGWMWLAVGAGGLIGGTAGDMIDRFGAARTHAGAFAAMAASLGLLAFAPQGLAIALVASALFGAAYMTLTGFYLVRGTRILANRPEMGPVLPLVATASGQVIGSPAAGTLIGAMGHAATFFAFAGAGLAAAIVSLWLATVREAPAAA